MILVTGANGLVGSYLCRYLLSKGEKVRGLKRSNSDMHLVNDMQGRIEWMEGDILDFYSLEDAMQGIDQVYHCAAFISYLKADEPKLMEINVQGTANVVNAAMQSGIKKLMYVSSIAALGRTGKDNETITEDTPWDRKTFTSDYSLSKFLAEREVWRGISEGLNAVIINPSIIIGAGKWNAGSCRLFTTVYEGFKFYTTGTTGYVDVRDVVKIAVQLMQRDIAGERFILNSENITYKELLTTIATGLKVKPPSVEAGKFLSGIAWRAEWLKSKLSGRPAHVTRQTANIANKKVYFSNDKIIGKIGYEFQPVHRSIAETAKSFLLEKENRNFTPLLWNNEMV